MNRLVRQLSEEQSGILLYGMTPPKADNPEEKLIAISERRMERLKRISVDGIVLYDIQDESARNTGSRPFPFLPTVNPIEYRRKYLGDVDLPAVYYRCVGKYALEDLSTGNREIADECTVYVGSSSRNESSRLSLKEAYENYDPAGGPMLGGVVISERHMAGGDEHLRMIRKQTSGVRFFISQFVFDTQILKDLVSDYVYHCRDHSIETVPLIFTLTPCGSMKTVDLLKWLGVKIPRWVMNELHYSDNTLEQSLDLCMNTVNELSRFCLSRSIPFGFNIESVSIRKDEVLASFELARNVDDRLKSFGLRKGSRR